MPREPKYKVSAKEGTPRLLSLGFTILVSHKFPYRLTFGLFSDIWTSGISSKSISLDCPRLKTKVFIGTIYLSFHFSSVGKEPLSVLMDGLKLVQNFVAEGVESVSCGPLVWSYFAILLKLSIGCNGRYMQPSGLSFAVVMASRGSRPRERHKHTNSNREKRMPSRCEAEGEFVRISAPFKNDDMRQAALDTY